MASISDSFARGVAAFNAGDIDLAIEELEAATHENHEDYKAFCYLSAAYARKNRYNAAIGAFMTAEQIAPEVASIHYNIGQAYEASGILDEAEYEYQRAVEIKPDYAKAEEALAKLKARLHHI